MTVCILIYLMKTPRYALIRLVALWTCQTVTVRSGLAVSPAMSLWRSSMNSFDQYQTFYDFSLAKHQL